MRWLRGKGVSTAELKAAKEFGDTISKVVVYTEPTLHDSLGKKIVRLDEAKIMYRNYLASEFYDKSGGDTFKFIQVGARRFRVRMKNDDITKLAEGRIVDIEELVTELNFDIMIPIFSIDYISNGKEMIAIDFNIVQRLDKLGFRDIMSADDVMTEIKRALIAYNSI